MIDSLSLSFDCFIGAILKAIEIETNTQHFYYVLFTKL